MNPFLASLNIFSPLFALSISITKSKYGMKNAPLSLSHAAFGSIPKDIKLSNLFGCICMWLYAAAATANNGRLDACIKFGLQKLRGWPGLAGPSCPARLHCKQNDCQSADEVAKRVRHQITTCTQCRARVCRHRRPLTECRKILIKLCGLFDKQSYRRPNAQRTIFISVRFSALACCMKVDRMAAYLFDFIWILTATRLVRP